MRKRERECVCVCEREAEKRKTRERRRETGHILTFARRVGHNILSLLIFVKKKRCNNFLL